MVAPSHSTANSRDTRETIREKLKGRRPPGGDKAQSETCSDSRAWASSSKALPGCESLKSRTHGPDWKGMTDAGGSFAENFRDNGFRRWQMTFPCLRKNSWMFSLVGTGKVARFVVYRRTTNAQQTMEGELFALHVTLEIQKPARPWISLSWRATLLPSRGNKLSRRRWFMKCTLKHICLWNPRNVMLQNNEIVKQIHSSGSELFFRM